MAARRELVLAIGERYQTASSTEKRRILDEFVAVTGYHRKHAIRVLRKSAAGVLSTSRPRARLYDEAVREALVILWEASDRICGNDLSNSSRPSSTRWSVTGISDSPRRYASECWR
jgi:hypothetical protein